MTESLLATLLPLHRDQYMITASSDGRAVLRPSPNDSRLFYVFIR